MAESKIPGRELRAIAWFGAYLAANPNAPNAGAVRDEIDVLDVKSQSNNSHLLKALQESAAHIEGWQHDLYLHRMVRLWAESGDVTAAHKIFDVLGDNEQNGEAYSDIVNGQLEARNIVGALATAAQIQKALWRDAALESIVETESQNDDTSAALTSAALIQDASIKERTLGVITKALLKAGRLAEALRISDLIHAGDLKDEIEWNLSISQSDVGDLVGAQTSANLIQGHFYNGVALAHIASAQAKAGDIESAKRTVALLPNEDAKCGARVDVARAQAKTGDIADARETLTSAFADAVHLPDTDLNKDSSIAGIGVAQATIGDVAGAQETVAQIRSSSFKSFVLEAIAEAKANAGDIAGALTAASLIEPDGQYSNERGEAQCAIATAQAASRDIAGAYKTGDLIQSEYYRKLVILDIAKEQAKVGDIAGALKTSELLHDLAWKTDAQSAIAEAQFQAGNSVAARDSFALARTTAGSIPDAKERCLTLVSIARGQVDVGYISGARNSLTEALIAESLIQLASDRRTARNPLQLFKQRSIQQP